MIFRRANKDDVSHMLPLWQHLMDMHGEMDRMFLPAPGAAEKFGDYLTSILDKENFFIPVAEIDGKIAGYGIASISIAPEVFVIRKRLYVQDIMVDPAYRRQGVAKGLVEEIKAFAKEQGVDKMDLLVAIKNESATKFWKEMGFEPALTYMNLYLV